MRMRVTVYMDHAMGRYTSVCSEEEYIAALLSPFYIIAFFMYDTYPGEVVFEKFVWKDKVSRRSESDMLTDRQIDEEINNAFKEDALIR